MLIVEFVKGENTKTRTEHHASRERVNSCLPGKRKFLYCLSPTSVLVSVTLGAPIPMRFCGPPVNIYLFNKPLITWSNPSWAQFTSVLPILEDSLPFIFQQLFLVLNSNPRFLSFFTASFFTVLFLRVFPCTQHGHKLFLVYLYRDSQFVFMCQSKPSVTAVKHLNQPIPSIRPPLPYNFVVRHTAPNGEYSSILHSLLEEEYWFCLPLYLSV